MQDLFQRCVCVCDTVLPFQSNETYVIYICLKSAVRMLQAANRMWIHVRERDSVDSRRRYDWTEPGLYVVEQ